jgi:hypothetical protein
MFGRPSLIATTVKAGLAIALISVAATNWISNGLDRSGLTQLAGDVTGEPLTTGALRERAASTRLDPCAAPKKP